MHPRSPLFFAEIPFIGAVGCPEACVGIQEIGVRCFVIIPDVGTVASFPIKLPSARFFAPVIHTYSVVPLAS